MRISEIIAPAEVRHPFIASLKMTSGDLDEFKLATQGNPQIRILSHTDLDQRHVVVRVGCSSSELCRRLRELA